MLVKVKDTEGWSNWGFCSSSPPPTTMWRNRQVTIGPEIPYELYQAHTCTHNRLPFILLYNKGPNSPRTKDYSPGKISSSGSRNQSLNLLLGPHHPIPHIACWGNDPALIRHFCHAVQGDHCFGFRSSVTSSQTVFNMLRTLLHVIPFSNG